jgi:hypothetical protein
MHGAGGGLDRLADGAQDLADLAAKEDQGDDGEDRDEREDECVFGEALAVLEPKDRNLRRTLKPEDSGVRPTEGSAGLVEHTRSPLRLVRRDAYLQRGRSRVLHRRGVVATRRKSPYVWGHRDHVPIRPSRWLCGPCRAFASATSPPDTTGSWCSVAQAAERGVRLDWRSSMYMASAPHVDADPIWGSARSRRPEASAVRRGGVA